MGSSRVHCTSRVERTAKKSRHRVAEACSSVCKVLAFNPQYGDVVKGHPALRKMRVRAPGLTTGKSGGYRLIYTSSFIDECHHIVLLALYYKGDREDLTPSDYRTLDGDGAAILRSTLDYSWEPPSAF